MNGGREGLVLVTGSSGFIGRALVARLAPRFDVVALDRSCPAEPPPDVDCVDIDLASDEGVRAALHQVGPRHGDRIASARS